MKCDKCGNIATVHLTEINAKTGTKSERHLCEACAGAIDLPIPEGDTKKSLDEFLKKHGQKKPPPIEPND
ncbi:MAG TPA: hypothetical protein VFW23_09130 [Tepidisphaeraceae bacterium]|nr:hypothetical protein [Tepidisphaeraceae bacterium]